MWDARGVAKGKKKQRTTEAVRCLCNKGGIP